MHLVLHKFYLLISLILNVWSVFTYVELSFICIALEISSISEGRYSADIWIPK